MEKLSYEKNFQKLEEITDSLSRDEVGIDDLIKKSKEALKSAKICMDILEEQKTEFNKLEKEFSELLNENNSKENNITSNNKKDIINSDDAPF